MFVVQPELKRLRSILTALGVGLAGAVLLTAPQQGAASSAQAAPAPDVRSPAPSEPSVRRLANGLRYVIVPRRSRAFEDSARVGLRLRVEGGWLAESSGERGLAHLIEHVATDGNGRLSAADVVKLRDELTVASDWGAWTSPDSSEYFLTSRSNDPAALDRAMLYLRGIATGMKFERATVDRQRQVVANERALRRQDDLRQYERARVLAPGSSLDLAEAYVSTDVATASVEAIERVYRRLYRPENVTLTIVGDVDPEAMDRLVRRHFEAWEGRPGPDAGPAAGRAPRLIDTRRSPVSFERAPGTPPAVLLSSVARSAAAEPGDRRAAPRMIDRLTSTLLNQRLDIRAPEEGLARASFSINDDYPTLRAIQWEAVPGGDDWEGALGFLLHQLALADLHGFSDREVAIAKKRVLRQLADERDWAAFAPNARIAERIGADRLKGLAPLSPDLAYKLDSEALGSVDSARINREWREMRRAAPLQIRVESEALARVGDPAAAIAQAAARRTESEKRLARIPAPKLADRLAYRSGPAGAIRSDDRSPEGVRRVIFSNNVALSLIRRPHEGKWLEIALDVDSPSARNRLSHCEAAALPLFVDAGGSARQSASEMREAILDSDIRLAPFYASGTGVATSASVRREDVASAIPYLYALVAEPGFRSSGTKAARARARSAVKARAGDPAWALRSATEERLAELRSGRKQGLDPQCAERSTMANARKSIGAILSEGVIEIAVAGNFDEQQVIGLVESTFGTVPARRPDPASSLAARSAEVPAVRIDAPGLAAGQNLHGAMWEFGTPGTAREMAVQQIVATAFARALYTQLVERSGLAYWPRGERVELNEWFARPVLFAASAVPADRLKPMAAEFDRVARAMADSPMDPALLDLARRLSLDGVRASYNEDRVWAYQAVQLGRRPDAVRQWRQTESEIASVPAEEIGAFAKKAFARQLLTINPAP